MSKEVYIDFEFNRIVEPEVNLVCAATYVDSGKKPRRNWWLHNNGNAIRQLADYLLEFDTIIGYSTVAESRSFMALGLDPLQFEWIDLFIEYRMMTNHNDRLQWGKQLVDGRVKTFRRPPPKWERSEDDGSGFKATHSLVEATYKLTGEIRDSKHKQEMRDLIISNPKKFTTKEANDIMKYCMEDVVFLPRIRSELKKEFSELTFGADLQVYEKEAKWRGRYSAHTALMEARGYPIDVEKTRNFSRQVTSILDDAQREINKMFPESKPFRWNKKENRFSFNTKVAKDYISANHDTDRWLKTDKGALSLSLDAWQRFYDFKHSYPENNFGAQMVRYLKLKQSLYGFSDSGGKRKNFWDSVGSDGRARPYMNHYGAQSGRSQPAASGFMFLKPAWMRSLVVPAKGKFIANIDYGQQEFFIAGLESNDANMIAAYLSGDPYLYGAKLAGAIPQHGTKETHGNERDVYKNTYLGIQFGMTKYGLAFKLSNDTGRPWTEDMAQEQIDIFEDTFPDYMDWKQDIIDAYNDSGAIKLPCGWIMWGDNDNERSIANVPVQGFGASVMRKAVDLAVKGGCKVIFTLHDAIYIEDDVGNERSILILRNAMREAFTHYFPVAQVDKTKRIKLDPFAWSPDYKKDSKLMIRDGKYNELEVPCSNLYIDKRAKDEYEKFSKYFLQPDTDLL